MALGLYGSLVCPTHPLRSTGSSACVDDDGGSRGIPPHGRMTTPAAKAPLSSSGVLFIRARPLRSEPLTQVVRVVDVQIGLSRCSRSGSIVAVRRHGHDGGPGVRIGKHAGDSLFVAPCPLALLQPRIDATRRAIGKIDDRDQARAAPEKLDVAFRRELLLDIHVLGPLRANIDLP